MLKILKNCHIQPKRSDFQKSSRNDISILYTFYFHTHVHTKGFSTVLIGSVGCKE